MTKWLTTIVLAVSMTGPLYSQNYQPAPGDTLKAITAESDGTITMRIYAPQAKEVKLGGTDIAEMFRSKKMTRLPNGVWELSLGPLQPGAYRYRYDIDGVPVMDPRNSNDGRCRGMLLSGRQIQLIRE